MQIVLWDSKLCCVDLDRFNWGLIHKSSFWYFYKVTKKTIGTTAYTFYFTSLCLAFVFIKPPSLQFVPFYFIVLQRNVKEEILCKRSVLPTNIKSSLALCISRLASDDIPTRCPKRKNVNAIWISMRSGATCVNFALENKF